MKAWWTVVSEGGDVTAHEHGNTNMRQTSVVAGAFVLGREDGDSRDQTVLVGFDDLEEQIGYQRVPGEGVEFALMQTVQLMIRQNLN